MNRKQGRLRAIGAVFRFQWLYSEAASDTFAVRCVLARILPTAKPRARAIASSKLLGFAVLRFSAALYFSIQRSSSSGIDVFLCSGSVWVSILQLLKTP